ncbi:response regulator [Spirosoma utsteinense]|uniref:CheY-like chemotaxis protein n=1 Tax=Spirosoma utsteinense TaxID=2585773 RepID=A0ABR6WDG5_9BACT|nr:response regulator [Spirosoma utsteinense]MBC3784222.1 CheY-like chemotaxis protein [Spirosoma utsteinense]MBC3793991.1 CheY-like chemotaxis protein [Spirosoma utsteinense]
MDVDKSRTWRKKSVPILVIEDNPDHQLLIGYSIRATMPQAEPVFVYTPTEALAHLHTSSPKAFPSLVLLDLSLPALADTSPCLDQGWQLLSELRTSYPRLPIIVLSHHNEKAVYEKAYELGVHSYINKPMGLDAWEACFEVLNAYWFGTVRLPSTR